MPINLLDPRPGTPLADHEMMSAREALQAFLEKRRPDFSTFS